MNLAGIVEYVTTVSGYLLATLGGIGLSLGGLVVFALSHPEKLEKWFSILLKLLGQLPGIFRGAHKQYVKHDLQGRVNSFVRGLAKQAPYLEARRLSLEWVEGEITKRSFLQDDKVVARSSAHGHFVGKTEASDVGYAEATDAGNGRAPNRQGSGASGGDIGNRPE